jgi:hypothetical protein
MSNTQLPNDIKKLFQEFGKLGGQATKRKYGKRHFSEAGKRGMAKRWGTKKTQDSTT